MALKKIKGTTGNDTLTGSNIAEFLIGLAGNDKLYGKGGDDRLDGGDGNDLLDGGTGNDKMFGGAGNDTYYIGQAGDDVTENAGGGTDTAIFTINGVLWDEVEKLVLAGTANIDGRGNGLDNTLTGNDGDNKLDGKAGADRMTGMGGDDTYTFDAAGDKAVEATNGGTDTVIASLNVTLAVNLENATLTGIDNLSATGNSGKNVLTGNDGNNTLDGGTGVDWMIGGLGNDHYVIDNTADKITENAGEGTDDVTATVSYTLSAEVDNLTLAGSSAIDGHGNAIANIITGNNAANKLYADNVVGDGNGGDDQLIGGGGNDTLYSGDGSNTLDGGDGTADIADYTLFSTAVTVNFDGFVADVTKLAGGTDTLTNIESARGGTAADTFTISYAGNFYGGGGDDDMSDAVSGDSVFGTLFGEGGADTLSAGADGGALNGGADNDTLIAETIATLKISMTGGAGSDSFDIGANYDGSGGALADGTIAASTEIKDFVDGTDHLIFNAFGTVDTAQEWYDLLVANNTIEEDVAAVELQIGTDGGGQTLIVGLTIATFSADDILVIPAIV